jgi:hypothetical protein
MLDDGEAPPMFAPAKTKLRGAKPATARRLRLKALQHVAVLRAMGEKERFAYAEVAKAYGRTVAAIKAWRRTWRKESKAQLAEAEHQAVSIYRSYLKWGHVFTLKDVLRTASHDGQLLKNALSKKA